ncbi:alpha-L-rhamnosidase C-terminal domain-containing protein [Coraliomargarita parva]|uniref:alpha-L-rhamnosidase-related protein n=1 Tax=Coraliomargarita parva TaxID=3014050 RepID=UPI0022B41BD4|nr:alpha-L-rhamnosidase C-terminal domain-containing protein [Coraliomargarita parva]
MQPNLLSDLPAPLKEAKWIWPQRVHWDLQNCYAQFRKEFELPKVPKKAPLFITADQSYQLYINGHYVCRGPARGFQSHWPYDEVDVAAYLQAGSNQIAIRAHNPGFSNFQYLHQGYAGLLVAAKWGKTSLQSDSSWRCRRQTGLKRDMVPTSLQLFPQESIDLRIEDPDWMRAGYNDSLWNDLVCELAVGCLPWYGLESRGIPMLKEATQDIGKVIGEARGNCAPDYLTTRNLSVTRHEEGLEHKPSQVSEASTIRFQKTGKAKWRSVLIDLGKIHVGSTLLEIEGAQAGEIIEAAYYETVDPDTLCPHYDTDAHCRMAFSNRLICRTGSNSHEFYHPYGFRYMILTVRDTRGPITVHHRLRSTLYPIEQKGSFNSSDKALNAIWETCAWTEQVCSLDAYVDTPHREQAQWWGDARVQAWNTFHLSGDSRLFKRGIDQIASQTTLDGVTYGHAPTTAHGCVLPDFTLIWMLTLWDYYWQTGSLDAFKEHQETIVNALAYFESQLDKETGLLRYDHRFWLFLDWTGLHKHGCSSVYNLWYLHALDRLSQMYSLIGDSESETACIRKAKRLRRSLRRLINSEGLMQGGYAEDGALAEESSVHAQTLAILTGLAPKQTKTMLEQRLLPYVRGELKTDITPSAYWVTYVYTVLSEHGYGEEVLDDIRTRWTPMVEYGTTWENFDPVKGHESFSHAWSAHPLFHFMQILGGIRQTAPEWAEVVIESTYKGDHADTTIPSPRGMIRHQWQRKGDRIEGKISVPSKVQATLILPGQAPQAITRQARYQFKLS